MRSSFCLPFPPSMNTYWRNFRGRTVMSKAGRQFREEVIQYVIDNDIPKFGDRKLKLTLICAPETSARLTSTTASKRC